MPKHGYFAAAILVAALSLPACRHAAGQRDSTLGPSFPAESSSPTASPLGKTIAAAPSDVKPGQLPDSNEVDPNSPPPPGPMTPEAPATPAESPPSPPRDSSDGATPMTPPTPVTPTNQTSSAPPEVETPKPPPTGVKAEKRPVDQHPLVLALSAFIDGRPEEAVKHLGSYDQRSQDILLGIFPLVADVDKHNGEQVAEVLQAAWFAARAKAPLRLGQLYFSEEYLPEKGNPKAVSSTHFRQGDEVYFYAEIMNLAELPVQGRFIARYSAVIELRDAACMLVKTEHAKLDADDASTSPRPHIPISFRFIIPSDVAPGYYSLRIRLKDHQSERAPAEGDLSFRLDPVNAVRTMP